MSASLRLRGGVNRSLKNVCQRLEDSVALIDSTNAANERATSV
jgi:hypothetical protein